MRQFPTIQSLEEALLNAYRDQAVPVIAGPNERFARFEVKAENGETAVCEVNVTRMAAVLWEKLS